MATPEELENQRMLDLADGLKGIGTPGVETSQPAIKQPVNTQPLPTLQSLQGDVQGIRDAYAAEQEAILDYQTKSLPQRSRTKFLNPGQSFADAFSKPSEAQRAFAFNAGLALLSSSGTNNLSQRIGQALGSGMQGMQAARQEEIDTAVKAAQANEAAIAMQGQGLAQEVEFSNQVSALNKATTVEGRAEAQFEINKAVEARNVEAAKIKAAETLAKKGRIDQMGDLQFDGLPVFENYNGELVFATGAPLSSSQLASVAEPVRSGISIGSGGQLIVGTSKEVPKADQTYMKRLQEGTQGADASLRSLNVMENAIAEGLKTGSFTGPQRVAGQVIGSIESALGSDIIPFGESSELQNTLGKDFDVEAKSLAVQGLKAFGGSDTERELLVSLSIQPSLDYTPETNKRILTNKRNAIELLMQEEDFASQWLQENGSLQNPNEDGNYFRKEWMNFQKENYRAMDYTGLPKDIMEAAQREADSYSGTSSKYDGAGRVKSDFGTDNLTVQKALKLITQ